MSDLSPAPASTQDDELITDREAVVLHMAADGHGIEEIADRMSISSPTVRNHFRSVIKKMSHGDTRPQATVGHPSTVGGVALTMLPVRLPRDQYTELKVWCAENKFSMATVVRGLVERFLADQQKRSA